MTNRYDGPSFFRHTAKIDDDANRPDEHQTLRPANQRINRSYKPAALKNKAVKAQLDLTRVVQQLHKAAGTYFVVVNDISTPADGKIASVKENKPKTSNKALGHSLNDILAGEQNAQRNLKIFDNQD